MKIVSFDELCQMPPGTIFANWERCYHRELRRLGEIIFNNEGKTIDYFYCEVVSFSPNGCGPSVSNIMGRHGMFDYDEKYLIWESDDVARVVRILTGTDTDDDSVWPDAPIPGAME